MSDEPGLPKGMSLYLDGVRFVAALAVVLEHVAQYPFSQARPVIGPLMEIMAGRGAQAVAIFFVLSGFVIAHVVRRREASAAEFAAGRISRLYSVIVPALVLTALLDAAGTVIAPGVYAATPLDGPPAALPAYLASLALVNEWKLFGPIAFMPGSNLPYWSLSFEATYYLIAGLLLFARRGPALAASALLLLLAGPTIAALFPLWLLGFGVYRWRDRTSRMPMPAVAFATTLSLLLVVPLLPIASRTPFPHGLFPWGAAPYDRFVLTDYATGIIFAAQLLALHALARRTTARPLPRRAERLVRRLGALTFPLYAIHFPALFFFAALSPFPRDEWPSWLFVLGGVAALTILLTWLSENWRPRLRRALLRTFAAGGRAPASP